MTRARLIPPEKDRMRQLRGQGVPAKLAERIAHAEKLELALSMAKGVRDLVPIISDLIRAYRFGGIVS